MSDTITLYVKTHNKTGLKYFGKTTKLNVEAYKGSGTYWKKHIIQYGYDVTTEIIGTFNDYDACKKAAIDFSIANNICASDAWANITNEYLTGTWEYINTAGLNLEENWTDKSIKKHREGSLRGASKGGLSARDMGVGVHGLTKEERMLSAEKGRVAIKEKYGVDSIFSIINKDPVLNAKKKLIFKEIAHQQGEKNSNYGNMWITDGIESKRINKNIEIPTGWRKGRDKITCN